MREGGQALNEIQNLSNDLNVITAEINSYKQVAGQAIFEIGKRLKHVKENDLVHGEWIDWLDSIEMNRKTAHRFITVYDRLPSDVSSMGHLGVTALYEIATLPPEEREKEHTLSSGETKTPDEMTVRELQEVKRQLREAEQAKQQAEKQAEQAKKSEEIALRKLEEEQSKEPEVIERVIEDETKINQLEKQVEHIEQEKKMLENRLSLNEKDANEYRRLQDDINNLRSKRDDVVRQIDNASSIGKFIARIDRSFEEDLAPIKYSRAIEELGRSEVVQDSLENIVSKVENWCREIRGLMKDKNIVEVIDHEG